jgi:hypothetical protein
MDPMTGYLPHDANVARMHDMHTRAAERRADRRPTTTRHQQEGETPTRPPIAIRRARDADRVVLERLAALDSAPVPAGEVLIAEVGDEPQAAIEVATGATVADPFRLTGDLVELLALRAAGRRDAPSPRRRLALRRRRPAYRAA